MNRIHYEPPENSLCSTATSNPHIRFNQRETIELNTKWKKESMKFLANESWHKVHDDDDDDEYIDIYSFVKQLQFRGTKIIW